MQWISLVGTALGAVIALLATMTNDRLKWRRDQAAIHRKLRQDTYAGFLAALTKAHERMRAESATRHSTPAKRQAAFREIFLDAQCYTVRYEVAIVAGQAVLDHAERTFTIMRHIRDILGDVGTVDSEEYRELRRTYSASLRELQQAMRTELEVGRVEFTGGS